MFELFAALADLIPLHFAVSVLDDKIRKARLGENNVTVVSFPARTLAAPAAKN